jgi:tetratricopeptide (TPR) repeat protein
MKKSALVIIALVLSQAVSAQKMALQTAINWLNYDDLDKAKESIDQASQHESTATMPKTWYYRGQIYHAIHESTKEQFKTLKPGSLDQAFQAYEKTLELDQKGEYKDDIYKRLRIVASQMINRGVDNYRDKDYKAAMGNFEQAIKINEKFFATMDTLATYNAALSAEKSQDYAKAKQYYNKLVGIGYGGAKTYSMLTSVHIAEKDTAAALETLKTARQKYPGDVDLSITELNIYLAGGKNKEAADQIEAALINDPKNANLYVVKGVLNDRLGKIDVASAAYKKAIEIKPDYFDAYYNLAAMLLNDGVALIEKANMVPNSRPKEFEELKSKADARFKEALPHFEMAYKINPKDLATLQSLKQLYAKLNQAERSNQMKKEIEDLNK